MHNNDEKKRNAKLHNNDEGGFGNPVGVGLRSINSSMAVVDAIPEYIMLDWDNSVMKEGVGMPKDDMVVSSWEDMGTSDLQCGDGMMDQIAGRKNERWDRGTTELLCVNRMNKRGDREITKLLRDNRSTNRPAEATEQRLIRGTTELDYENYTTNLQAGKKPKQRKKGITKSRRKKDTNNQLVENKTKWRNKEKRTLHGGGGNKKYRKFSELSIGGSSLSTNSNNDVTGMQVNDADAKHGGKSLGSSLVIMDCIPNYILIRPLGSSDYRGSFRLLPSGDEYEVKKDVYEDDSYSPSSDDEYDDDSTWQPSYGKKTEVPVDRRFATAGVGYDDDSSWRPSNE